MEFRRITTVALNGGVRPSGRHRATRFGEFENLSVAIIKYNAAGLGGWLTFADVKRKAQGPGRPGLAEVWSASRFSGFC